MMLLQSSEKEMRSLKAAHCSTSRVLTHLWSQLITANSQARPAVSCRSPTGQGNMIVFPIIATRSCKPKKSKLACTSFEEIVTTDSGSIEIVKYLHPRGYICVYILPSIYGI